MSSVSDFDAEMTWKRLSLAVDLLANGRIVDDTVLGRSIASHVPSPECRPELFGTIRAAHFANFERNLAGLAVGYKDEAGRETGVPCLRFYVLAKRPLGELDPEDRIPAALDLPGIGTIPTDVQELREPIGPDAYTARLRPALGGYSIGHPRVGAGTLGCLVEKTDGSGDVFVLGNCHTLADCGRASRGDDVWQPARHDGGGVPDRIGPLADFVDFKMTPLFNNRVDAAIVGPVTKAECQSEIVAYGRPPRGVRTRSRPGDGVQKVGRTTGHQKGLVRAFHAALAIPYRIGPVRFLDLVESNCYSDKGDSGALMMDGEGYALGLHMASSPGRSFFCPIAPVLSGLGIDVVTYPLT